jgi:hypothetical protein
MKINKGIPQESNETAESKPQQNTPMAAETHPPISTKMTQTPPILHQNLTTLLSVTKYPTLITRPIHRMPSKNKRTKLKHERNFRGYKPHGEG